jgi:hypothetical protein
MRGFSHGALQHMTASALAQASRARISRSTPHRALSPDAGTSHARRVAGIMTSAACLPTGAATGAGSGLTCTPLDERPSWRSAVIRRRSCSLLAVTIAIQADAPTLPTVDHGGRIETVAIFDGPMPAPTSMIGRG